MAKRGLLGTVSSSAANHGALINIAIIGCGPAGLATALLLERTGHNVELLERFAEPSPVGSGLLLQPTGQAILSHLGLLDEIEARGQRIDRIVGHAMPKARTVLDVHYASLKDDRYAIALHRAALFETLHDAVRGRDIALTCSVDVVDIKHHQNSVEVIGASGQSHGPYDLIVDASGANTPLHSHAAAPIKRKLLDYGAIWGSFDLPQTGFDASALAQRYIGAHTMVGVLPMGQPMQHSKPAAALFWSLRHEDYARWLDDGLDVWKAKVESMWPETAPLLEQIDSADQMTLATYGHHTLRKPYGERLVFVGDAAHATSPQLGQGVNMALLDAMALSVSLAGQSEPAAAIRRYAALRRNHVYLFQLASYTLTGFYQSDSRVLAALRDTFFAPLSRLPLVRQVVSGLVSGLLGRPIGKL